MTSTGILDDMATQKQAFAPVALPVDAEQMKEAHSKWEAEFRLKYEAEMRMTFMSSHTAGIAISRAASTAIYAAHSAQLVIQNLDRDVRGISKEVRLKRLFKDMIILNIAKDLLSKQQHSIYIYSSWFGTGNNYLYIGISSPCSSRPDRDEDARIACTAWDLESNQNIVFDCIKGLRTFSEELDRRFKNEHCAITAINAFKASFGAYHTSNSLPPGTYTNPELLIEYLNEREKEIDPVIREELKQELKSEMEADRIQELKELKAEMKAEFNL